MPERSKVYVVSMAARGPGEEGVTSDRLWASLVAGQSGISMLEPVQEFADCKVKAGGMLSKDLDTSAMPAKDRKRNHPVTHLSATLGHETMQQVNLLGPDGKFIAKDEEERYRIGCVVGSAASGTPRLGQIQHDIMTKGEDSVGAFDSLEVLAERPEIYLCKMFDIKGVNFLPVSACATGSVSLGIASEYLRYRRQDLMIAGSVDRPFSTTLETHLSKSLFTNLRALARLQDGSPLSSPYTDPTKLSRPFAPDRFGFVMAEGGAEFLLATEEQVVKRGLNPLAELRGYAITNDAFHDTLPSGIGAKMAMLLALEDAGLGPDDVEYINAHATSTDGDEKEVWAIKQVFGANRRNLSINAPKSMHGHLVGAAGAIEAWECIRTIMEGVIPPTINQENGSIDSDLDFTPNVARYRKIGVAVSNSFGFGGGNASLVLTEPRLARWV